MDRYVLREPRIGADYPHGNHTISYPANSINMVPDNYYPAPYGVEYPGMHRPPATFPGGPHVSPYATPNVAPHQAQVMSGIDPRYLAAYNDGGSTYVATGQQMVNEHPGMHSFGADYENRSFVAVDRNNNKVSFQANCNELLRHASGIPKPSVYRTQPYSNASRNTEAVSEKQMKMPVTPKKVCAAPLPNTPVIKNTIEPDSSKTPAQIQMKIRSDKLKALHKSGTRVFSGPIEKVLKWHKALQDVGIMVLYELVAKCVNIRPGEGCAKNLVVRDDNGPAMQVVYYEIDYLLPELKPPCTVRVIGKMMPGTCRLQAFSVRPATGDDVSTLPRRAALAAHHIVKLCRENGISGDKL